MRYALEGSVQRSGGRMRINVQLIDAESGNHLWAERFDKPVADLFDMQDEIVARLADQIGAHLVVAEARHADDARDEIVNLLRHSLSDEQGNWTADYVRLRFAAHLSV